MKKVRVRHDIPCPAGNDKRVVKIEVDGQRVTKGVVCPTLYEAGHYR